MENFRKKLCLYLACIIFSGIFAPVTSPTNVNAAILDALEMQSMSGLNSGIQPLSNSIPGINWPNWIGTDPTNRLEVVNNQSLVLNLNTAMPELTPVPTGDGTVLLRWPLANSVDFLDLYVLRHFNIFGSGGVESQGTRRIEMMVQGGMLNGDLDAGPDGASITVNFDILRAIDSGGDDVNYMSMRDPIGLNHPTMHIQTIPFQIFMPETPNQIVPVPINQFFEEGREREFGPHIPAGSANSGRVVNDRLRWSTEPPQTPLQWFEGTTPYHEDFLDHEISRNMHYPLSTISWPGHPNYDPNDPDFNHPNPSYVNAPPGHYATLTPSFEILYGNGFGFRYDNMNVYFWWGEGYFYVQFNGGINYNQAGDRVYDNGSMRDGLIYEFELEHYARTPDTRGRLQPPAAGTNNFAWSYYFENWANRPWSDGITGNPNWNPAPPIPNIPGNPNDERVRAVRRMYTQIRSFRINYLTNLSNFGSFPYAHIFQDHLGDDLLLPTDTPPGFAVPYSEHGLSIPRPAMRHTLPQYANRLPLGSDLLSTFSFRPLVWDEARNPLSNDPTAQEGGVMIHFDMPRMFDEETAWFSDFRNLSTRAFGRTVPTSIDPNGTPLPLPVTLTLAPFVVPWDDRLSDVIIEFQIGDDGETMLSPNGVFGMESNRVRLSVEEVDLSYYIPVGGTTADPRYSRATLVIDITLLPYSAQYENVSLNFTVPQPGQTAPGSEFVMQETSYVIAHGPNEVYTFLRYHIHDPGFGLRQVIIDPAYLMPGSYTLWMGAGPLVPPAIAPPGEPLLATGNAVATIFHDGRGPLVFNFPLNENAYTPIFDPITGAFIADVMPPLYFQLEFSPTTAPMPGMPGAGLPGIFSQQIWYRPVRRQPNLPMPDNFNVTAELRARDPVAPDFEISLEYGVLTLNPRWHVATHAELLAMLMLAESLGEDAIYLDYILHIGRVDDDVAGSPPDPDYVDFVGVRIRVERGPDDSLSVTFDIHDVDVSGTDPVLVNQPQTPLLPGSVFNAPNNLRPGAPFPTLQIATGGSLTANIQLEMDVNHRDLSLESPPYRVRFPGLYFMYTRALSWRSVGNPNIGNIRPYNFRTLPDFFVISELPENRLPSLADITLTAVHEGNPAYRHNEDDFPHMALNVEYSLPLAEIGRFLEQSPGFTPMFTTNLYIGAFEGSIRETFFPVTGQLNPEERAANVLGVPYDPAWGGAIDLSAPDIQAVLRGENNNYNVIRIENIPLLTNPVTGARAEAVDIFFRDPSSMTYLHDHESDLSDGALLQSLNILRPLPGVTPPPTWQQRLTIHGLDENSTFFTFADLTMRRYFSSPAALRPGLNYSPSLIVSDMTAIAGATTEGIPDIPAPDELDPTSPAWVEAETVPDTHGTARVWWPALVPVDGIAIEYEIIRVQDGPRLSQEQMQSREVNLIGFLNSLSATQRRAWQTSLESLYVSDGSGFVLVPDDGTSYVYYPSDTSTPYVTLIDRTLVPNQLYFYYVRAVYVVDGQRRVSGWVEATVTTDPVSPPMELRSEDGSTRPGFDPRTMRYVSWRHNEMARILTVYNTDFIFQYQLRLGDEDWGNIINVPTGQMIPQNLDTIDPTRIFFMLSGLDVGTDYQMRVRLLAVESNEPSLWSNIIVFMTGENQGDIDLERDVDNWLNYLRNLMEELLRRPYWPMQNTPTNSVTVYRPGEIWAGEMLRFPGTLIPLYNADVPNTTYFLPTDIIRANNEARRGMSIRYSDMEFILSPSFISFDHNQVLLDMTRAVTARGSELTDAFIRVDIEMRPMDGINGVPALSRQANISFTIVATNTQIRDILDWDDSVLDTATNMVERHLTDPVLRQGIKNLLLDSASNEDMVDQMLFLVTEMNNAIANMVANQMHPGVNGILSNNSAQITHLDNPMYMTALNTAADTTVNVHELIAGQWVARNLQTTIYGRAVSTNSSGTFAFTGRTVQIQGTENLPFGASTVNIAAHFGLEDFFGVGIDLGQNADRRMVIGSIARIAGAPANAEPIAWVAANMDVHLTSRNGTALIPRQEAVALVMSLYARRTGTRMEAIQVRNFQNTNGMSLDPRYADAVRAAFEVGIISDTNMNPAGAITIGEFLDMLTEFNRRISLH